MLGLTLVRAIKNPSMIMKVLAQKQMVEARKICFEDKFCPAMHFYYIGSYKILRWVHKMQPLMRFWLKLHPFVGNNNIKKKVNFRSKFLESTNWSSRIGCVNLFHSVCTSRNYIYFRTRVLIRFLWQKGLKAEMIPPPSVCKP